MKEVTLPSWFYNPVVNFNYSGLNMADIKTINNLLLDKDVLFSDCKKVSKEYEAIVDGMPCMVADYYFN